MRGTPQPDIAHHEHRTGENLYGGWQIDPQAAILPVLAAIRSNSRMKITVAWQLDGKFFTSSRSWRGLIEGGILG
jgi:hypothetical protein